MCPIVQRFVARSLRFTRAPLPSPDILAGFEQIVPGSANRIIIQFEEQSAHRRALEANHQTFTHRSAYLGTACALVVALSFLGVSGYLIGTGHDAAGGALGTIDIVGMVTAFLSARYLQQKDLQVKAEDAKRAIAPGPVSNKGRPLAG